MPLSLSWHTFPSLHCFLFQSVTLSPPRHYISSFSPHSCILTSCPRLLCYSCFSPMSLVIPFIYFTFYNFIFEPVTFTSPSIIFSVSFSFYSSFLNSFLVRYIILVSLQCLFVIPYIYFPLYTFIFQPFHLPVPIFLRFRLILASLINSSSILWFLLLINVAPSSLTYTFSCTLSFFNPSPFYLPVPIFLGCSLILP